MKKTFTNIAVVLLAILFSNNLFAGSPPPPPPPPMGIPIDTGAVVVLVIGVVLVAYRFFSNKNKTSIT